jgi:hypothetical protein
LDTNADDPNVDDRWSWVVDPDLRRELEEKVSPTDHAGQVRAGFIILERRIRQTAGLEEHDIGAELIDKVFGPDKGLLQPVSPVKTECVGLHHLLKGIFLYYRNPVAHNPIDYTPFTATRVLYLIDQALMLVNEAAASAFNLTDFVGPQEGNILHRHDFRLDIDNDGVKEIVVLLGFGRSTDGEGLFHHLGAVILKKRDNIYFRIPSEPIRGYSMHQFGTAELRYITNVDRPDIVLYWLTGENGILMSILREENGKYVIAKRDCSEERTEPIGRQFEQGFLIHFYRQTISMNDIDGDGRTEITQVLLFDPEDLPGVGYPGQLQAQGEVVHVCRVLKWNPDTQKIEQVDERLTMGEPRPTGFAIES